MKNQEVADLLNKISALLELKGENRFKVIAYAEAARRIENLSTPIENLYREGKLNQIPGVGQSIAEKIKDFLETGKSAYLEELTREVPEELIELEKVPGVGPKVALLLFKELGIKNLGDLEKALSSNLLRNLPRLGPKSEENIKRGLETLKRRSARIPLGHALPLAEELVQFLKQFPFVKQVEACGSLRRMKETIGDLDILVASREEEKTMKAFTGWPEVQEVLAVGPTKSSVLTKSALQVDLRVVRPDSFGSALQYFTGSQAHNIKLREIAIKKGLKLNEYGVFRVEDDKKIAGETEEEVYSALDLPWIPPELREDQGEIERAKAGDLPALVELKDIKGDLHVHSDWSDGTSTIEEMVKQAKAMGYEYLAICDHAQSLGVAGGLTWEKFKEQGKIIQEISQREDFHVLWGLEANILAEGDLDFPEETLKKFQIVVAGVHSAFRQSKEKMTERIVKAIQKGVIHILSHPTGRLIEKRDPYEVDVESILKAAQKNRTSMEINSSPERLDLRDLDCRKAKEEYGIKMAINTDAHSRENLSLIKFGVAVARRGWLEKKDVLNTYSWDDLQGWLKKERD
ncbi:MAG: DNA polymerase/3'-5' exonuclease PolX [Caldiserica bacterium]|jgi:DNA polymerase (family 10)|nr:DNA polymerase/3'-5' exonuclease PolX [Caldisericota bacterium]MDH7562724.1 DNA polymerase/3'-5' exonuclease PolX [Caldisericota bacterium]